MNTEDLAFLQKQVLTIDGQRPERLEEVRGRIHTARRRRAIGTAVVASVAMVVAVAGAVLGQHTNHQVEPAPPVPSVHNGALLGTIFPAELRQVAGEPLPALPGHPPHAESLRFSPDGTRIFYAAVEGGLYSLDLTTGKETLLGHCPRPRGDTCAGVVDPDGTHVAYHANESVYVKDLRTGVTRTVFRPEPASIGPYAGDLSWSPDGRRIAFLDNTALNHSWLTVVDLVTGETSRVTQIISAPAGPPEGPPAWSPDGTMLAYIGATRIPGQQPGRGVLLSTALQDWTVPALEK